MNAKFDPKIFKAYDIRGIAATEITPELAEAVGRAVVAYTGAKIIVVGRDMRETSPELSVALIKGIVASGADVVDIGLTSTPMFYYAVGAQFGNGNSSASSELGHSPSGAGIMVTASHNPKEYNGFKMVRGNLLPIGEGSGMEDVRDLALAGNFSDAPEGNVMETDVREEYVAKHLEIVPRRDIGQPRVVFDAGNGMSGYVTPGIIKAYGLEKKCKKLFFELDGSFPNHEPNPIKPENLTALIRAVIKEKADIGVSYDGDSDRVGFVDENGKVVRGDIVTALLAPEVLADHPGAVVLYDLRSSRVVAEAITNAGGKPVVSRVGHAFIKKQMRETDACFAGEFSTHYYFKDFFIAESSDLAVLMILRLMKRTGKKLSELVAPLMHYYHSGEINFAVKDKEALFKAIAEKYEANAKVLRIDGIRYDFPSWWFNVRASNTEPLVRLNLEAETGAEMKEKIEEVSLLIKRF
jgi:phosphomannomutase